MGLHRVAYLLVILHTVSSSAWYERYKEFFTQVIPNNATLMELYKEHLENYRHRMNKRAEYPIPYFTCPTEVPTTDTNSVHKLRPGDVKVVAAIGDSLTAGNGIEASWIFEDLTEYRGKAWSIGGDSSLPAGTLTLPNIFKMYRPYVYGYSLGKGDVNNPNSFLNLAEPGAIASDMRGQAERLVEKMKRDTHINFQNDWKIVTLFIGGNDLCSYCENSVVYSANMFAEHVKGALDVLHAQMPRTFVNMVTIFDIAPIAAMEGGFICSLAHQFVCACGKNKANANMLLVAAQAYAQQVTELVNTGRYDTRDDFTVVVQPFFENTVPPNTPSGSIDLDFFSPDCFHFNAKGHAAAALSLWNNMVEGVNYKKKEWHLYEPFYCPGQIGMAPGDKYFATKLNSGSIRKK